MVRSAVLKIRRAMSAWADPQGTQFGYRLLYGSKLTKAERERLRSLNVFRGDGDLLQLLRRMKAATDSGSLPTPLFVRMGAEDISWVDYDGFRLAVDNADVAVSQYLMRPGAWEPHMDALFRQILRAGMSVIDVGANVGYYTILAAHLVGPSGRVTAFEPNSENNRLLLLSRAANQFDHIELIPVALSDHTGYAAFSAAMGSNGGFRRPFDEQFYSPQCQIVPVMRLDDLYSGAVDFIKMDIEGAETLALSGATRILDEHRPMVSTEFCPHMIRAISGSEPLSFFQLFLSRNYQAFLIDKATQSEIAIEDPAAFLAGYGSDERIEDLLFRPRA